MKNSNDDTIWDHSTLTTVLLRSPLYMKTYIHVLSYLAQFFLDREMFQITVVQKIKTHILCCHFFFFEDRAVNEIMWKNIVERGRPQITIQRIRIAFWIHNVTNTHSEYVILIASPLQQWWHERALIVRLYVLACLVIFFLVPPSNCRSTSSHVFDNRVSHNRPVIGGYFMAIGPWLL